MSKATFVPAVTETEILTIEVEAAKVVLELTPEEALAVYKLVNSSGRAVESFDGYTLNDEKHAFGVYHALAALGLRTSMTEPAL